VTAIVENDNIRTCKFCMLVDKHLYGMVGNITTVLLQISCWFWQWRDYENQL